MAGCPDTVIERFSPFSVPPEAASFARQVVAAYGPATTSRAKALLFACSKLAAFALSRGLELETDLLFRPSLVERFVMVGMPEMSQATRRTVRANLRHMADILLCPGPPPCRIAREASKPPYGAEEIASYLALADAQPTRSRRLRASALVCLGAGAGLVGSELRAVRGGDVISCPGGLLVAVSGSHARRVPLLRRYEERLGEAAESTGDRLLLGGSTGDPNVLSRLTASLSGGTGLSRIETGRLRASWLAAAGAAIGLAAFLSAAGPVTTGRLVELASFMDDLDEHSAVALLRG